MMVFATIALHPAAQDQPTVQKERTPWRVNNSVPRARQLLTSASGQNQTSTRLRATSALCPKADIRRCSWDLQKALIQNFRQDAKDARLNLSAGASAAKNAGITIGMSLGVFQQL
jgi:hypothetical protein